MHYTPTEQLLAALFIIAILIAIGTLCAWLCDRRDIGEE